MSNVSYPGRPVVVPNDFVRNPNVSPEAARLYVYLLAYEQEDGDMYEAAEAFAGMGKETTEGAIDDLISLGYMEKTEIVKNGKVHDVDYNFFPMGKN